jgi:hypothetical protein
MVLYIIDTKYYINLATIGHVVIITKIFLTILVPISVQIRPISDVQLLIYATSLEQDRRGITFRAIYLF